MSGKDLSLFDFDTQKVSKNGLIGVDEAGRGPLAGPVTAAAVWIHPKFFKCSKVRQKTQAINDSKKLTEKQREELLTVIHDLSTTGLLEYAWTQEGVKSIEDNNILGATQIAMRASIDQLGDKKGAPILVDGKPMKKLGLEHQAIVKGDSKSLVIAMASIIAKVQRDKIMHKLDIIYPDYGFKKHKGYGTAKHREAVLLHGPCKEHRALFLRKTLETQTT